MARFFTPPRARPISETSAIYAGSKLYFYVAGTTTPQNVYSDSTLVTPLSNPVVADGNGQFVQIYVQAATYRVDFKTSADVLITSDDNVDFGYALGGSVLPITLGGTGASTASGARTNLGLGTAAVKDVGVIAGQVPVLGASAEISAAIEAATIVAYTEDTSPDLANDFLASYDVSALTMKKVHPSRFGKFAQVVTTEVTSVASGTTLVPYDDTVPQSSEGDQYATLAITPQSATSTLIICVNLYLTLSTAGGVITMALFQDATASALAATALIVSGANSGGPTCLTHIMTSGTTSATTFKVRAGLLAAGTITLNGLGGARRFGGVAASTITIMEILP